MDVCGRPSFATGWRPANCQAIDTRRRFFVKLQTRSNTLALELYRIAHIAL
jgi:hypothetical protein